MRLVPNIFNEEREGSECKRGEKVKEKKGEL